MDESRQSSFVGVSAVLRRLVPPPALCGFLLLLALIFTVSYAVGAAAGPVAPGMHRSGEWRRRRHGTGGGHGGHGHAARERRLTATEPAALVTTDLTVGGMTCAACVRRVENKLGKLDGVTATVNLATGRARVSHPPQSPPTSWSAVEEAGYTAALFPSRRRTTAAGRSGDAEPTTSGGSASG